MADEMSWKEVAFGFGAIVLTLIGVVYKTLTGQLQEHKEEDKQQDMTLVELSTRMALLEQKAESQHTQVLEALQRIGTELHDWRADAKDWREGLTKDISTINERFAAYDRNIAAFYRENTHLKKPEGG